MERPIRYIVLNPSEDTPTSYNCALGVSKSLEWAKYNARQQGGEVICEYADGTKKTVFVSAKAAAKSAVT